MHCSLEKSPDGGQKSRQRHRDMTCCWALRRWGAVLFVALTLDFPGGLAHWFSLVHIPYRCEFNAEHYACSQATKFANISA